MPIALSDMSGNRAPNRVKSRPSVLTPARSVTSRLHLGDRRAAASSDALQGAIAPDLRGSHGLRKLKTLIDLVSESNISELEITEADGKVRIVKASGAARRARADAGDAHVAAPRSRSRRAERRRAGGGRAARCRDRPCRQVADGRHLLPLRQPGRQAFVEIGSMVKEGEPICIIEAMKIMNEIEADTAGTIREILCENGQAVEFGQPLFVIE